MKRLVLPLFLFLLFIVGCATTQLSNLQRRAIEAKELDGSYEDAYRATIQVLQDYGYVIKHSDYNGGIIVGELGMKTDAKWFWTGSQTSFEVTAHIEQWTEGKVKERITFVEKTVNKVWNMENNKVVEEPKLLQKIYDDIQKEIFVRQNLGK